MGPVFLISYPELTQMVLTELGQGSLLSWQEPSLGPWG